jgi:hypothetical protein
MEAKNFITLGPACSIQSRSLLSVQTNVFLFRRSRTTWPLSPKQIWSMPWEKSPWGRNRSRPRFNLDIIKTIDIYRRFISVPSDLLRPQTLNRLLEIATTCHIFITFEVLHNDGLGRLTSDKHSCLFDPFMRKWGMSATQDAHKLVDYFGYSIDGGAKPTNFTW